MRHFHRNIRIWLMICLCGLLLCGCGGQKTPPGPEITASDSTELNSTEPAGKGPGASVGTPGSESPSAGSSQAPSESKELRPNQPKVLEAKASGTAVLGGDPLVIDISHTDQGYVMARYNGSAAKASVLITGTDGVTYKYFLPPGEEYWTLPLTCGSGAYEIGGYENIEGSKYAVLFKEQIDVSLESELLPFLYPNMFVSFNADSKAVAEAEEIVKEAENDIDAVALVYHYVIQNVKYDQEKADTVNTGYLPTVDETLETGKGICFDYAALTAAMLRSQQIPTKLEIGYAGTVYHAWISVYIEEIGWIDRLIEFSGDAWTRMDPTFASNSSDTSSILKYIGDGSNYHLQYSR